MGAAAAGQARAAQAARRDDHTRAVQAAARAQLETQALDRLQDRYDMTHERLRSHDDAKTQLDGLNRRLRGYDQRRANPPAAGPDSTAKAAAPSEHERRLIAQRTALEAKLMAPAEEGVARRFVEAADRHQAEQRRRFSDRQLELALDELRHDAKSEPDAQRHGWRARRYEAGLPPSQLAGLSDDQRAAMVREHIIGDLARDRALFAALPDNPATQPGRRDRRAAIAVLARDDVRDRAAEFRAQRRHARRHQHPPSGRRPPRT